MHYYLDDTPVDAPIGLDGLTLKKARNPRYWGFLLNKLGANSISNISYRQAEATRLLKYQFQRYGVEAVTRFRMVESGVSLYDGYINYSTYSTDGQSIAVDLRDEPGMVNLEAQATTDFAINPTVEIKLHTRPLGGLVQLLSDPNSLTVQKSATSAVAITHSVPLTRKADSDETVKGTLYPVVTPLALDPFYRNTTTLEQSVKLSGVVGVVAKASATLSARLIAESVSNGTVVDSVFIGQYGVNTSNTNITAVVDMRIIVPVAGELRFVWRSETSVLSFNFTYTDATVISVTDEDDLPETVGYGTPVIDALRGLIDRSTNSKLSVRSKLFESGEGKNLMLLGGLGVRSVVSPFKTSFQYLFEGLSAIWNLSVDIVGDVVWVEQRKDVPRRVTLIRDIFSFRQTVATDQLYNQVNGGYATWQGTSLLARNEINKAQTYTTAIASIRSALPIQSTLIAASTLIEEQRRKQFDSKTSGSGKVEGMDDSLFVICAVPNGSSFRAETTELDTSEIEDYSPSTLYNRRLSPVANLNRWLPELSGSGPISLEGSTTVLQTPTVVRMNTIVSAPCTLYEYSILGNYIIIDTPELKAEGELMDAEWRQTASGETVTLTLLSN